jgi:hypothetical protein
LRHALGSFQAFLIFQISDNPDVLERFQNQFWKRHLLPDKPRKPRKQGADFKNFRKNSDHKIITQSKKTTLLGI